MEKKIKKILIVLLFSFALAQEEILLDKVSAVVEGKIVLLSDVVLAANALAAEQRINPTTNPTEYNKLLLKSSESMIEQLVIIKMAEVDSVEVLDKDIDRALERQIDNIISQAGGKEEAELALGRKISDFKRSYRDDMRGKLLAEKYTGSLTSGISVTRGEVVNFYNTFKDSILPFPTLYKTRHLLLEIKPSEESLKKALNKTQDIRDEIVAGLSFADAAKKYSEDIQSGENGGNLGYVPRGTFVQEFDKMVFTLDPNILSEPVKTQFGYHLIEVLQRSGEKVNARHILISANVSEEDKNLTYKKTASIVKEIKNKDDFILKVKEYSDDTTSGPKGGYMGMINLDQYQVKELVDVIKNISLNTPSAPVLTQFGYHIVWVDEKIEGGPASLDKNWLDLEQMALNQKKSDWYSNWIKEIKNKFYIKRNPLTYPQIKN
ncbi:MAG: peptidylprolyl isomerase [Candidatus Marinimicrobia bacterium]|jgi:peptidyl-prolyl cis-trans isomerase SurA|nr:peptidylprolyl isomerase [Candidatus Neomarinimicrobiota bacterium]MDG1900202.1 peptidylprolyl isomerase [Candidatus Neomarinimicrobiota bacterium]|tara:strand:+ start:5005 stop:6309 length:1305 start_codon:yes stop_codon:yes gene_type:complete